jgi:uncharacterized membrane protein HdeD (DUF308 family)
MLSLRLPKRSQAVGTTSVGTSARKERTMGASQGAASPGEASVASTWGVVARGIAAILFGLVVLAWPDITLRALLVAFGIFAIAAGVFAILSSLRAAKKRDRWLYLGEGVVAVLAGILAFAWPRVTVFVLLYIIAAWAMITGVLEMAGAFQTRLVAWPEWVLMASGAISIVFGVLLLVWPYMGGLALVWLIGIYAIVYGIIHLVLAFTGASARKAAAV